MKEIFLKMKRQFAGKWTGEGFAKFPTIDSTAYTEELEFIPDEDKDAIFYRQKTWYKNGTHKSGHTVFWDTGFIVLKEDKIFLNSSQAGGRMESLELAEYGENTFTFNSFAILNDPKSIISQRVFTIPGESLHYELNMAIHGADFQNHLKADLKKENTFSKSVKRAIVTSHAAFPLARYSQAIISDNTIYVSAQLGQNMSTGEIITNNIEAETAQVMENIKAILAEAGANFNNVVKMSIFLKDMQNYEKMNRVYGAYVTEPYPARETIEVSALPKNVNIEIAAIAVK